MTTQLQEAIRAIKAGDVDRGRRLLLQIVKVDPENERAWLWLASSVEGERRAHCLERVLAINPANAPARRELEKLRTRQAPPQPASAAVPAPGKKPLGASAKLVLLLLGGLGALSFLCALCLLPSLVATGAAPPRTRPPTATTGPTSTPAPDPFAAWIMCKQFVEQQLVAPSTAKFGNYRESIVASQDNDEFHVIGQVDAQNSFGAMLRKTYFCNIRYVGNDRWRLLSLELD